MKKPVAVAVFLSFISVSVIPSTGFIDAISSPPSSPLPDPNEPPVADASGPYYKNVNDEIMFDGSGSYDPDGTITNYTWNFGDGSTGFGEFALHSYFHAYIYTVILTVIDDDGAIDTDTTISYINGPPYEPYIEGPTTGKPEIEYEYFFASESEDGDDVWYYIDWGGIITQRIGLDHMFPDFMLGLNTPGMSKGHI